VDITTSPDISKLDFRTEFDLSAISPSVKVVNLSVGNNLADCTWWFDITTPSGAKIHEGSESEPDEEGVWAEADFVDSWPQPFSQIEWSGKSYRTTLYVKDSEGNVYSTYKEVSICRPLGNTKDSPWNFGKASVFTKMDCNKANLYVEDKTNYVYKGLEGEFVSHEYTMNYPPDEATSSIPAPFTLAGAINAIIPISSNGKHTLFLDTVVKYTYANGEIVYIKYKAMVEVAITCNIDLCPLICDFERLSKEANETGNVEKIALVNLLQSKMLVALIAFNNPACGVDLPALIEEIKKLGGFSCSCGTSGTGINGGNPFADLNVDVSDVCGDMVVTAEVTGQNIVFTFKDKSYQVKVADVNTTEIKAAFSFVPTFDADNCLKKYELIVDADALVTALDLKDCCPVFIPIKLHGTTDTPPECPFNPYDPALNVYDVTDTNPIGLAFNANDLIAILNADAGWSALGKAIAAGHCQVAFIFDADVEDDDKPTKVGVDKANVVIDPGGGGGDYPPADDPGGPAEDPVDTFAPSYTSRIKDMCTGLNLAPSEIFFPSAYRVKFTVAGDWYAIRPVVSYTDLINKINALDDKPANITLYALPGNSPSSVGLSIVNVTPLTASGVVIQQDHFPYALFGANHHKTSANGESINWLNINSNTQMGTMCAFNGDGRPWHTVIVKGHMYVLETNGGKLHKIDITNPVNPVLVQTVTLAHGDWSGAAVTDYDGFFVQATTAQDPYLYILESSSGMFMRIDPGNLSVVDFDQDDKLKGKQPRCIYEDKLYFTHYGNFETAQALVSGVDRNEMVVMDLNNFGSPGIITFDVFDAEGTEEPWAASIFNNYLYVVGNEGSVAKVDMNTLTVVTLYETVFSPAGGEFTTMCNSVVFGTTLFVASYGKGTHFTPLLTIAGGTGEPFDDLIDIGMLAANVHHYNFHPVPNKCYGVLTFGNEEPAGVARFTLDGKFIDITRFGLDGPYNVHIIPFPTTSFYPNTLC
jgi:hypothetical protein